MRHYVAIAAFCVTAAAAVAQDHLGALGISEGRAKEAVFDSFVSDAVSIAGKPAAFIAMPPEARVALVNFALTLARTFAESDDFTRRYADHREANGPDPLPDIPTVEEVFAKQRAGFENQVAEMRKLFDQITPEQRATLEAGWKDMRDQLDAMEKGDRRKEIENALREERAAQARAHAAALKELEKVYPTDPRSLVAMRLRHFLDVTRDVDFEARLVETSSGNGAKKWVFADAALEARPAEWKMAFRAGKPALETARAFALRWLADLEKQGVK
jgi:formate-dependent nitrite reductase cytochrome c552 subunit